MDIDKELKSINERLNYLINLASNGSIGSKHTYSLGYITTMQSENKTLLRELKSAIFYIKTYGGEVTDSFSAGGNMAKVEKTIKITEKRHNNNTGD